MRSSRAAAVAARSRSRSSVERGAAGDGLDAPHALADRRLREDLERPDLGRARDVRAAAELAREVLDLDDAHDVAVLLAEEHHRAEPPRLVLARSRRSGRRGSRPRRWLTWSSTRLQLLGRHGRRCEKSKRSLSGRTDDPRWRTWSPSIALQRAVQEVRRGVIGHRRRAQRAVDARADGRAALQRAVLQDGHERLVAVEAQHLLHRRPTAVGLDRPVVGDLAAALGVERRRAELHEQPSVAELLDGVGGRLDVQLLVADERRWRTPPRARRSPRARDRRRRPGPRRGRAGAAPP